MNDNFYKNILVGVLVALIVLTIYMYVTDPSFDAVSVDIGGEKYNVQGEYPDSKQAAELIKNTSDRVLEFLRYLKQKYRVNGSYTGAGRTDRFPARRAERVATQILHNYNPEAIIENDPQTSTDTSYTINKGQRLYICLRYKTPPYNLHDIDLLMFIVLHELSHMGTQTYGHNDEFWETFKFVLKEATSAGVYNPVDYMSFPIKYCGLRVDYNPMFDRSLRDI